LDFKQFNQLTFEEPDVETFKNLGLAYKAMDNGGNMACILNAANEIAVQAFLDDKIKFLQIAELNEACMETVDFIRQPTIDDYIQTDQLTRETATNFLAKMFV
jgi:1-deoxy-D-xylulose-5-phosphate reductoisomerase